MGDALPSFEEYSSSLSKRANLPRTPEGGKNTIATQAPGGLDFEILRQAIEERNADTLVGFHSEEA